MDRACPRGLKRALEKFDSARLSRKKKANFVHRRKLLLEGYKFKETKHDIFGKRPAATQASAEKFDERSMEAGVNAFRRSIGLFFFSLFNDRLTTLDLRFLL